jgi:hypothetical protein
MARRAASVMGAAETNVVPVPAASVDRGVVGLYKLNPVDR